MALTVVYIKGLFALKFLRNQQGQCSASELPTRATRPRIAEAHAELTDKIQLLKNLSLNTEEILAGKKEKKEEKKQLTGLLNSETIFKKKYSKA